MMMQAETTTRRKFTAGNMDYWRWLFNLGESIANHLGSGSQDAMHRFIVYKDC